MLSGKDALGHLNNTLTKAREQYTHLSAQLNSASDAVANNQQQQGQVLKRIAALRLDELRRSEVASYVDAADYQVRELLEQREVALAKLLDELRQAENNLRDLETRRADVHIEVDRAAELLVDAESKVQAELENDSEFQAQLERTRSADAVAVSALEKAELAEADRVAKGEPFESDRLFSYLWRRNYGTSDYKANLLTRALDAWVARLCRFKDARANYWMLLEIPKRLKEHAETVRADADAELNQLQLLEEQAARKRWRVRRPSCSRRCGEKAR